MRTAQIKSDLRLILGLKGLICRFAVTCVAGVERGGERERRLGRE